MGPLVDEPFATAIHELSERLLTRQLHKQVGRCSPRDVTPEDLYEAFGEKDTRRSLEKRAAAWAGIDDDWKLVIWLPPAGMRLKPAGVLVSDGSSVRRFVDYERPSGQRGNDIYQAHENLWSVAVYVAPELRHDPRVERALVWLAREMDVRWEQLAARYSETPATWPQELFRAQLEQEPFAPEVLETVFNEPMSLRAGVVESFETSLAAYRTAAKSRSRRKR